MWVIIVGVIGVTGLALVVAGAIGFARSWIQSHKTTAAAVLAKKDLTAPTTGSLTGGGISIYVRVAIGVGLAMIGAFLAFYNPVDTTPVQAGNTYGNCHMGLSVPRQVPAQSVIPVDLYSDCIDPLRTAQLFANGVQQSPPAITRYNQSPEIADKVPSTQATVAPIRSWSPSASDSAVRWYVKSAPTTAIDVLLVPRASQQLLHSSIIEVVDVHGPRGGVPAGEGTPEPPVGDVQLAGYTLALNYPSVVQKDIVYAVQVSATCTSKCKSFPDLTLYVNGTPRPDAEQVPLQISRHPAVQWFVKAEGTSQRLDLVGYIPTSTLIKVENAEHTPITVTSALSGVGDMVEAIGKFATGIGTTLVGILFFMRTGKQQQLGGSG